MPESEPASTDPIELFAAWFADAESHVAVRYANAACLATVDGDAADARIVLVHTFDASGFVFGTDSRSAKVRQLSRHPRAALVFHWEPIDRQVRVRGPVRAGAATECDLTFDDRPRESRITAWASQQSHPVSNRAALERRWRDAEARFEGAQAIPRPTTWRGYRLVPEAIEFWHARRYRLHERHCFKRMPDGRWRASMLEP